LTGVWRGTLKDSYGKSVEKFFEMQIFQKDSVIGALINYDYTDQSQQQRIASINYNNFIDGINCDCNLIPKSNDSFESSNTFQFLERGFGYSLKWYKNGNKQYLIGRTFKRNHIYLDQNEYTDRYIILEKIDKITSSQSLFIQKNITRDVVKQTVREKLIVKDLLDEEYEMVKKIFVNTKKVTLSFYDYSQIDLDKVTIYVDRKPIIINKILSDEPFEIVLEMDKKNTYEVIFVAENLGAISPNTAEMKIKAGRLKEDMDLTSERSKRKSVFIFKNID
jgi:hypothetical protein